MIEQNEESPQAEEVKASPKNFSRKSTALKPLKDKFKLDGHLDCVRGTHFIDSMSVMVSISDDCTIKLWDLKIQ